MFTGTKHVGLRLALAFALLIVAMIGLASLAVVRPYLAPNETISLIIIVVAAAGGLAAFVAVNIGRQISHRERAEAALRRTQQDLEERIEKRRSQLVAANKKLQDEMAARQSAETELKASEDRYRKIVESAEDMIYRLTPDGRVTFVNAAAAKLVRRSPDECRGMHFLSFTRRDFRTQALEFYRRQIADQNPLTYLELPLALPDGTEVWVGQNVQLISEDEQIVEVQAVSRDVTHRKRIEQRLLESEGRYRMLFEGNPQPMWVFDAETLGFLEVNDAAVRQYGYSREEFLAMTLKDVRPAEDVPALLDDLAQNAGASASSHPGAWRHRHKNGTVIDVEVTWHNLEFGGRPAKLVLLTDVTKRRLAEAAVRASEQRYRDIFRFAPIGIYQSARDGSLMTANDTLANMLGYESVDELLKVNLGRDVYADQGDRQRLIKTYDPRGYSRETELCWKKKDGTPIWIELTAHSVRNGNSPTQYFEGFVRDITSRRRLEEERQIIADLIEGVITTSDLEELLLLVHKSISKGLNAENCFVALYDEETELLSFPFWIDKFDPRPEPQPLGIGFCSYVLKTGTAMLVDPALTEEMYARGEVVKSGSSSKSWLGVPLLTPNRVIGVLVVQHYEQENLYSQVDLDFLSSVGSQLALAIERKRAEQALQESEDRYHRLVELSPDGIIIHQDGRIVFVNGAGVKLVGAKDESQLVGQSVYNLAMPEYRELLKNRVQQMAGGGVPPLAEVRGQRYDGVEIDCEISSVPFSHGDRFATLAVVRDISERKRAEQALIEANQRALKDYERLVERIAALAQTLANERDLKSIFRAFRDFAEISVPCDGATISLCDPEKQVRRAVYRWVDDGEVEPLEIDEVPLGEGMVSEAIKSGQVIVENNLQGRIGRRELPILDEGEGERIPRSALTIPMVVFGRTIGCVEIQACQTEAYCQEHATAMRMAASLAASAVENATLIQREQEKEEQLRQAQKMEAVGRLAGGVAHDFNNLLTAINGYSDLTLRSLEEASPLRSRIEEIKKAGERAASLTRQLLAFSRKQMLQPCVLNLNKVISEMANMVRRLVGEDVMFEVLLAPDLGEVKADAGQIEQVLMNLAVNARDAMPTGGHLTVETRNVHLKHALIKGRETVQPGRYVVLSVSDDGCGMDDETQEKIFEPFFTTKEFGKGTGLGLATVYGIVKQSEGNIWVYSELGEGTTFRIYLPRVDTVPTEEESFETRPKPQSGNETILLVEDEDIVRNLSREVLQTYGYNVITAENGEDGLRVCREFQGGIDLIVTDLVMPLMSGRELAEQLAVERPKTSVLYMSGFTDDAIVRHGLLEENIAFLQKPFTPELLAGKVRELLDQAR